LLELSLARGPIVLHLCEQNRTSSHARAHFLRQVNGRPHASQRFVGRSALARIFGIDYARLDDSWAGERHRIMVWI